MEVYIMWIQLLDGIKAFEWVKWHPCRGYGRLLAAVALSMVLKLFYKHRDSLIKTLFQVIILCKENSAFWLWHWAYPNIIWSHSEFIPGSLNPFSSLIIFFLRRNITRSEITASPSKSPFVGPQQLPLNFYKI